MCCSAAESGERGWGQTSALNEQISVKLHPRYSMAMTESLNGNNFQLSHLRHRDDFVKDLKLQEVIFDSSSVVVRFY